MSFGGGGAFTRAYRNPTLCAKKPWLGMNRPRTPSAALIVLPRPRLALRGLGALLLLTLRRFALRRLRPVGEEQW